MANMLSENQESVIFVVLILTLSIVVIWILVEKTRLEKTRYRKECKREERERLVYQLQLEEVKKASERYNSILELNQRYQFNRHVRPNYECCASVKSKAQFDRFSFDAFLEKKIDDQLRIFENVVNGVEENRRKYHWYKNELTALPNGRSYNQESVVEVSDQTFKQIEERLCSQLILTPVIDTQVLCRVSYHSPLGRNSYSNEKVFSYEQIKTYIEKEKQRQNEKDTVHYQRKLMTDSLRYDVLKRDAFRCVICGRTARDGVKLHVDHIRPVSKGGKTELNNLRTLCDACNMGKRDKYDEYGCN